MEKLGSSLNGAGVVSAGGTLLGALPFACYKATSITQFDVGSARVVTLLSDGGTGSSSSGGVTSARITRPGRFSEFMDSLLVWLMICAATGLVHPLTVGNFLRDVVFDTIHKLKRRWQVAHELFLIYLERVEMSEDDEVTFCGRCSQWASTARS